MRINYEPRRVRAAQAAGRMRRRAMAWSVSVAVAIVALAAAGCGDSSSPSTSGTSSTTASSGETYKMTMVSAFPLAGNPFYVTMQCAAQTKAEELGVELKVVNPSIADVQHELPLLQAAIATKPDVILLSSIDRVALSATVRQAIADGIKFVYVDQLPEDLSGAESVVRYDVERLGVTDAKELAKAMGNSGKAIEVTGPPGIPTVNTIHDGFVEGLKGTGVTLKDTIYDPTNSASAAATRVASALSADPSITGVSAWINIQSDGVLAALRQLGRDDVSIVTNYGNYGQLPQLAAGKFAALIGLPAGPIGAAAVEQAYNAVAGKSVTREVVLPTFTITEENMDSEDAKPYLYVRSCTG